MPSIISIGVQQGGPEPCLIGDIKVDLYHALVKHLSSTHCKAIDQYAIVLRIDGSLDKFGEEGLTRLRFAKSHRYISVDIQIPESVWQPLNYFESKAYLVQQVRSAMNMFIARLMKEKSVIAQDRLWEQINAGISEFLVDKKVN